MDNYQAMAYASMALLNLQKKNEEITVQKLRAEMIHLMDTKSESEIEKLFDKSVK